MGRKKAASEIGKENRARFSDPKFGAESSFLFAERERESAHRAKKGEGRKEKKNIHLDHSVSDWKCEGKSLFLSSLKKLYPVKKARSCESSIVVELSAI